jgi:hypothetical protein
MRRVSFWLEHEEEDSDEHGEKNQDLAHLRAIFTETVKAQASPGEEC